MNIMKTNLLILENNKIRKENGDNTTVTAEAPVPQSTNPKIGMNALMFQGLKNLMENPELAQEAGVKNEGSKTEDESAKSFVAPYSSNIAFGKSPKFKTAMKALSITALLAAASSMFTSCQKDAEIITLPEKENVVNVYVTVTNESTNAAISALQTTLLQMYAQQKLTSEQFAEYMKKTEEWRTQTSAQIAGLQNQINALQTVLLSMGADIIDIKNGIDENNAGQKAFLTLLQQYGYSSTQALALLQEAINIAKQNGKTVADGMAYLIHSLNTIHNDLTTIIGQLDNAAKQREEQTNILNLIAITGQATKEQVEALNINMIETNNILKEQGNKFIQQLAQLGSNVTDAIGELARINQCTRADIIRGLAAIGIKIDANTMAQYMTSGVLSAQLQAALAKLDKLNAEIEKAKEEFKNDAAGYANKVISLLESIDAQLSAFVSEWTQSRDVLFNKLDVLKDYAKKIYTEEKYQSGMMDTIHIDIQDIKQQMAADHILLAKVYEKMQNNPSSLTKEDLEAIANQLGVSITTSIDDLAKLVAQEVEQGKVREQQLDSIDKKLSNLGLLSKDILKAIQDLDVNNLDALNALAAKIDALKTALEKLSGKIDDYAKEILKAHKNETDILTGIADDVSKIKTGVDELIAQVKKANAELPAINANLVLLQNQVKQLESKLGRTITPEELDKILADHDAANQEFYANLIKSVNINPKDYTSALDYIAELLNVLVTGQGKTNQYLIDLLEYAKTHKDQADTIIDLIQSGKFKIVVTCQCDCDGNNEIHEGRVGVLQ